ncbi:hypothetical protein INT45_011798 [Circinella minor]|uniref:Cytochrome P450 n=1 Tax=Circinella minor TaxID=1195481 RepID=A0A8H7S932_9FUNG|nr:hypothetical protein INT45_011798 [Circinella minor]
MTGNKPTLVIADPYMAHELLVSNGKVTSNRFHNNDRHDFQSNNTPGLILSAPDKYWNTLRKTGPRQLKKMTPVLRNEAREFADAISSTNENINPTPYLLRTSLNFILLTLSGVRTTSIEDPLFKKATDMIKTSILYTDFKYIFMQLVNPSLASVVRPFILGSNTIDVKREVFKHYEYILKPFYLEIIEKALDSDQDNLVKALNDEINQGKRGYYNNLMPAIHDIIHAGTDTSAMTIAWGFIQISTMPNIQKKIQDEIDLFVSKHEGRLPQFWEREAVPYLIATQRECFRMRPTTDFGVIHEAAEDFEWRGNIIPSGTFFMTNMIEMHMDPVKYPNPLEFKPERFLDKTKDSMFASANHKIEERDQYNFGWGRRLCVGAHLAENQMFNVWVETLYKCNIMPALNKNGHELPATLTTVPPNSGPVVTGPHPFELRFIRRN